MHRRSRSRSPDNCTRSRSRRSASHERGRYRSDNRRNRTSSSYRRSRSRSFDHYGNRSPDRSSTPNARSRNQIIKVFMSSKTVTVSYNISTTSRLDCVMGSFAETLCLPLDFLGFSCGGRILHLFDSPVGVHLRNGDDIEVFLEQDEDFRPLLQENNFCDLVLVCKNGELVNANKEILSVFCSSIMQEVEESGIIKMEEFSSESVQALVESIYCPIDLVDTTITISTSVFLEVHSLAVKFQLPSLKRKCKTDMERFLRACEERSMSCCVCLGQASEPQVTRCGHLYCSACILCWLRSNSTCPSCQAVLGQGDLIKIFGQQ